MSNLQEYATIRGNAGKLREMVLLASGGYHDDVYLRVLGDEDTVQFLTQSNARQVMSYCTFSDLKLVEGDAEAIIPVGLDNDTKGYLDYLSIAEGSGTIEMNLLGPEGGQGGDHDRMATKWTAEGALETTIRLPGSTKDLKKVPWHLAERWTDDERYISSAAFDSDGKLEADDVSDHTPPTVVETTTETVNGSIIDPADFMDDVNHYPLIVKDGEFRLNLQGNDGDDSIAGEVNAEHVEGPDVDRVFDEGFAEVFGELSGPVRLSTAPETPEGKPSPPLIVVQDDLSGRTIRHVIGPFSEV
jgi:hypothetical protein